MSFLLLMSLDRLHLNTSSCFPPWKFGFWKTHFTGFNVKIWVLPRKTMLFNSFPIIHPPQKNLKSFPKMGNCPLSQHFLVVFPMVFLQNPPNSWPVHRLNATARRWFRGAAAAPPACARPPACCDLEEGGGNPEISAGDGKKVMENGWNMMLLMVSVWNTLWWINIAMENGHL